MNNEAPQVGAIDQSARRTVVIRRMGVFSIAKVFGLVYAGVGLLVGAIFSVFSVAGSLIGALALEDESALIGLLLGVGSIFFFPIFYGLLGFLGTALGAAVYNLVAGLIGGIEMDIEDR